MKYVEIDKTKYAQDNTTLTSVDTMETQPLPEQDPTFFMDSQPRQDLVEMSPIQPMQSLSPQLPRASTHLALNQDDEDKNQESAEEEVKTTDECVPGICPDHGDDVISIASDEECVMSPQKKQGQKDPNGDVEKPASPPCPKTDIAKDPEKENPCAADISASAAPKGTTSVDPTSGKDESYPLEDGMGSDQEEQKGVFKVGIRGVIHIWV